MPRSRSSLPIQSLLTDDQDVRCGMEESSSNRARWRDSDATLSGGGSSADQDFVMVDAEGFTRPDSRPGSRRAASRGSPAGTSSKNRRQTKEVKDGRHAASQREGRKDEATHFFMLELVLKKFGYPVYDSKNHNKYVRTIPKAKILHASLLLAWLCFGMMSIMEESGEVEPLLREVRRRFWTGGPLRDREFQSGVEVPSGPLFPIWNPCSDEEWTFEALQSILTPAEWEEIYEDAARKSQDNADKKARNAQRAAEAEYETV